MQRTTISDGQQLSVDLLDYGARICRVNFADTDVALSYADDTNYLTDPYYLGATVGPIANRIANGQLTINGELLQMPTNEGSNTLHSGNLGFDRETWSLGKATKNTVEYDLICNLTRIGMRGRLAIKAIYTVENGSLTIEYQCTPEITTYLNVTNHVYLNLAGQGNIAEHEFELLAQNFVEVDHSCIPTGKLIDIEAPLNYQILQSPKPEFNGVCDHHFNVSKSDLSDQEEINPMLRATANSSGISVLVSGNAPGFQFYTGKYLGQPFLPSAGFCVEAQFAPDAINQQAFYSPLIESGASYQHKTIFAFSALN